MRKVGRTPVTTDFQRQVASEYLDTDITYKQLAEKYNVAESTIIYWVKKIRDERKQGAETLTKMQSGNPADTSLDRYLQDYMQKVSLAESDMQKAFLAYTPDTVRTMEDVLLWSDAVKRAKDTTGAAISALHSFLSNLLFEMNRENSISKEDKWEIISAETTSQTMLYEAYVIAKNGSVVLRMNKTLLNDMDAVRKILTNA